MSEEDDAFTRGFHDIPEDAQLRAMSYVALCDALHQATPGTPAFMVIEAEKRRRDSAPEDRDVVGDVGKKPVQKPGPDHWYKKPLPVIVIGVTVFLIGMAIRYVLRHRFGLDV